MNKELQPTDSITHLGVPITKTLWSQHITCIAKKTAKRLDILDRSRNLLPHQARITIYKAYIRPLMEYEPLKFGIVPLSHRGNVASLCVSYRHIFLQPSTKLADILPLEAPSMKTTRFSVSEHPFCLHIPRSKRELHLNYIYLGRVDCGTPPSIRFPCLSKHDCIQDRCECFSFGSDVLNLFGLNHINCDCFHFIFWWSWC